MATKKRRLYDKTRESQDSAFRYLKKIKRPVMILVRDIDEPPEFGGEFDRIRILEPNGICQYCYSHGFMMCDFKLSCFVYQSNPNLESTVDGMKQHQEPDSIFEGLRIFEVIEL